MKSLKEVKDYCKSGRNMVEWVW